VDYCIPGNHAVSFDGIAAVPAPRSRILDDFSVALGFIGLAMMALQFVLTARVNRIESSYGIDILLQFHRYTSIVAFFMVLVHPIILFVVEPATLQLLNFPQAPLRAQLATIATLAFLTMVVTTIWRKPLKIPYEAVAGFPYDSGGVGGRTGIWSCNPSG
jgi:3-phenylpropionate/trans-cinnamate dioxygenase ferredoxin reductase subunit